MALTLRQGSGKQSERDFHGAAIIGANGCEIPITEAMVEQALQALEQQWHQARRHHRSD